jgi:hypothetical protein
MTTARHQTGASGWCAVFQNFHSVAVKTMPELCNYVRCVSV